MTKVHGGDASKAELSPDTTVTIAGRTPFAHHGYVTPVYHASTLMYRCAEEYAPRRRPCERARGGTPTSEAPEKTLQEIDGPPCAGVALLPSGPSAICTALCVGLENARNAIPDFERGFAPLAATR
jgi:cystathionine beta-lyase